MHPVYIQAEIKKAGYTQKQIAQEYGCSEFMVSKTINNGWGSEPLMRFISEKIGKDPYAVFPKYLFRKKKSASAAVKTGTAKRTACLTRT